MTCYNISRWLIIFICIMTITSCSESNRSIKDALDKDVVGDDFTILNIIDVEDGYIVFFERSTFKDVTVALVDGSKNKRKTSYGGYLSQNSKEPRTHYTSAEIAGNPYSIYFGRLNEKTNSNIHIELDDGLRQEANFFNASSSVIWFIYFNERVESVKVDVVAGDS